MLTFEYLPNRKLGKVSGDIFDNVREHFSVKNENAFFMRKFGNRHTNSRIYAITPTGLFEIGMFNEIARFIKQMYPNEQIAIDDKIAAIVRPTLGNITVYDKLSIKLRDYQIETNTKAIAYGRGIIKLGTGGGKTLTIASLLSSIFTNNKNFTCLLIVPDLSLVNQTFNDFAQYKVPFTYTRWTGSIDPDFSCNVTIANTGILQSRFDENAWIKDVEVVVMDEVHKAKKGNKVCKILSQIKTPNKFGLTGTLPDTKIDAWNILGKIGDVIYDKSSYELRQEKFLTNVGVKIINISYKENINYNAGGNPFKIELDYIYKNSYRNSIISTLCKNFNNNVLIMVNHIAHGEELFTTLCKALPDKKIYFIRGDVEVEARAKAIQVMENTDNVVCVAISAIFSTGINIKNLHMIVFASGGKSFIRTIQSVGRGLRLNENKEKLTIIDIADKLRYSAKHCTRRKEIYDAEKIPFTETSIVEK